MSRTKTDPQPHLAVRRNALWNILGIGLPLVVAAFFIPGLIEGMGTERFGVLTLILVFLNYFGLFDLGIGRALTQALAGRQDGEPREEASLIWTVSGTLWILGACAAGTLFAAAPFMTDRLLGARGALAQETTVALRELALILPVLLHSLALKGILEAKRRFDLSNMIRIPIVVFTFGAPFAVLPFSRDLRVIIPVMLAGRLLAWGVSVWLVFRLLPGLWAWRDWRPAEIGRILRMGGWFTVSGIAGPVIDGMDRMFVSSMLSITRVAYYTTPYELVTKLGVISGGIGGAIFPEFALRYRQNRAEAALLFRRAIKYLLAIIFPFTLIATAYAHEGLAWWLNPEFAAASGPVLQWLSLYVFLTAAALVPFLFLGGVGRPDLAAKLHLAEIPLYALLLYAFIRMDGLRGAAIACCARILIDFSGMVYFSGSLMGFGVRSYVRLLLPLCAGSAILLGFHVPMDPPIKAGLLLAVLTAYAVAVWTRILEERDKEALRGLLTRRRRAAD